MLPENIESMVTRLNEAGYEAYAVGGCVRDRLLGLEPHDYDICTSALPEQTSTVFAGQKVVEIGFKHGTVTVISKGEPVEITTFRTDGEYKDGRHPQSVFFTTDLSEDLSRRDFTVNAMAYSRKTGVVDLFGGREDLQKKVIRCVGEPQKRFEEDALRILRCLRFCSTYGFKCEEKTADAVHHCKKLLKKVSAERIFAELKRLLCGNCGYILREFYDVFAEIIPEISDAYGFLQYSRYHDRDVWEHIVSSVESISPVFHLRFTMLLHDLGKPSCCKMEDGVGHFKGHAVVSTSIARRVVEELRCDSLNAEKICFLVEKHDLPMTDEPKLIKRQLNKFGEENFFDLLKVHIADDMAKAAHCRERIKVYNNACEIAKKIIAENDCFSLKKLAVNGNDMISAGYRGNEIGKALQTLLEAVIDGNCENNRESLLKYLECNRK